MTELRTLLRIQGQYRISQAYEDGVTPRFIACRRGHLEVVRFLVAEGHANVNQAINDVVTPLFISADLGHFGIVRVLARAGARLTDLTDAVWQKEEVLRALLQGCQDRLGPLLAPVLDSALVLPPGQGGLEPVLLPCVLEYALPATWEDVQEDLGVVQGGDEEGEGVEE